MHTNRHGHPVFKPGRPTPSRQDMLDTERRDFYKRAFLAALTGTAAVDCDPKAVASHADKIARQAVFACDMWKAEP